MNPPVSQPPNDPDLGTLQKWFQAVVRNPTGVAGGLAGPEAQEIIRLKGQDLESVIARSRTLSAQARLAIYANAYYARLLESLANSYPVLRRALGEEVFDGFAFGYLQRYPSRSYTLNGLGDRLAQYLQETRPDRTTQGKPQADGSWCDFLIDLARLEWAIDEVFDLPGPEEGAGLKVQSLEALTPKAFLEARLVPMECLRILEFRWPVNGYYTAARATPADQPVPIPDPGREFVALSRRDYVVRRHTLAPAQYLLLEGLLKSQTIGEALERAAASMEGSDLQMTLTLRQWFETWTREGFFREVRSMK